MYSLLGAVNKLTAGGGKTLAFSGSPIVGAVAVARHEQVFLSEDAPQLNVLYADYSDGDLFLWQKTGMKTQIVNDRRGSLQKVLAAYSINDAGGSTYVLGDSTAASTSFMFG